MIMNDTLEDALVRAKEVYDSCGSNEGRKKMVLQIFPYLLMSAPEKVLYDLQMAWDGDNPEGFKAAKEKIAKMLEAHQPTVNVREVARFDAIAPKWIEGKGVLVPEINKVVSTKDLPEEMNWHDAMKAADGQMGTKRDWAFIYAWKKEINDLLEQHGAEPIRDDWYWTETEYSATYAWLLNFSLGDQYTDTKSTSRFRVRPVSAFK